MIDGMLESAQEVHGSLQQARLRPHVMDDYTISRVCEAHGTQLDDCGSMRNNSRAGRLRPQARQSNRKSLACRQTASTCVARSTENDVKDKRYRTVDMKAYG